MIPKIIHQIWFQGWDELPEKYQENVDSVKRQNPDWAIMHWDNDSMRSAIKQNLGEQFLEKYDAFELLHQKVDFGRYCILYIYGGVSVDTDIYAHKGFDSTPSIQTSDFIVSANSFDGTINNATILVSAKNPLMEELLYEINTNCSFYQSNFSCIQSTTGPNFFSEFMHKHKDKITVLENTYLEPCTGADTHCEVPEEAIIDHRHQLSWLSPIQRKCVNAFFSCRHYAKKFRFPLLSLALLIVIVIVVVKITK